MNDMIAKIVLGVIALAAIGAVVILQTGVAIAPLLTLASFAAGGVAGVAVQGASVNKSKTTNNEVV